MASVRKTSPVKESIMTEIPMIDDIRALDGRFLQYLTKGDVAVLTFYRAEGRKFGVAISMIPAADKAADGPRISVSLSKLPPVPNRVLKLYLEGWANPLNDRAYRFMRVLAEDHWRMECAGMLPASMNPDYYLTSHHH